MKKTRIKFGILLVAALLIICFTDFPVEAADGGYTYTVRFFAGQQGLFSDGQDVMVFDVKPGDRVSFFSTMVELNNGSKYYVKGIRESGKDNNTVSTQSSFEVYSDMDYVVAYGLRGNMVAYTVRYVDANGDDLVSAETYYGNVGDKPVVAFLYIDGYQPQTYNLTKTLAENAAENVFTFIYTPLPNNEPEETVITITQPGTEETVEQVIPGDDDNADAVDDGGQGDDLDAGGDDAGGDEGDIVDLEEPEVPLGTIDLDTMTEDGVYIEEPSVPLADMSMQLGPIEVDAKTFLTTSVIVVAAVVMVVASCWYWRPYRKKVKNDKENAARDM